MSECTPVKGTGYWTPAGCPPLRRGRPWAVIFSEAMDLGDDLRTRTINASPIRAEGDFVLYWMIATRRPGFNFGLDRAIAWARLLKRPVIVLEALRVDYPWASDRFHAFVIQGMADNALAFSAGPLLYYPYVEPSHGAGRGLLEALGRQACVVVTDEFPCFFLPRMVDAAGARLKVKLEAVDSNGILPLRSTDRTFVTAAHFRRHVQKQLRTHLLAFPAERPATDRSSSVCRSIPADILHGGRPPARRCSRATPPALRALPIDHSVPVVAMRGGVSAGRAALQAFVANRLRDYHLGHNHPDDEGTSRLSPYLHFGHLSAHEVFTAVMRHEKWSAAKLATEATGARDGWWGVGPGPEAYLDQLIVWRELAYNTCANRPTDYDRFESLPPWAARDAVPARRRCSSDHVFDDGPRGRRDSRSAVERRAATDAARRLVSQLSADAVGEEDPGVVGDACGGVDRAWSS